MLKLVVLVALLGVAYCGVREYPAGVSPAACPNYPYCDPAVVAHPMVYAAAHNYPAGVSPAACPNYPYCHTGYGWWPYHGWW